MKPDKNKSKEKVALPKVDPELLEKAKKAEKRLAKYLEENKLDPKKDYTKDKKHGAKIKELIASVNVAREKVADATPAEKHHSKKDDKNPKEKVKAEKKVRNVASKYEYPKVDGKEMTADQKKKYRTKMRNEAAGKAKADKKGKKAEDKKPLAKADAKKADKKKDKKIRKSED